MNEQPKPKADRPETMRQARTWEIVKNRYRKLGLCYRCACQAAWGHQIGFSRIEAPCPGCAETLASFPDDAGNGWRKHANIQKHEMTVGLATLATLTPGNAVADTKTETRSRAWPSKERPTRRACEQVGCPSPPVASKVCHCTVCHENFTTPASFDRHRHRGQCRKPAEAGLERKPDGRWGRPRQEVQATGESFWNARHEDNFRGT